MTSDVAGARAPFVAVGALPPLVAAGVAAGVAEAKDVSEAELVLARGCIKKTIQQKQSNNPKTNNTKNKNP